jgi:glutathione S-transferase
VDAKNDFISFHVSAPFFNWFVVGAYFPQAFEMNTGEESEVFSAWSGYLIKGALARLLPSAEMSPFLLGAYPCLPDFHLFHVLELGKNFAAIFNMPSLNLLEDNRELQQFHDAMSSRRSTEKILSAQANEFALTRHEIFEEFGDSFAGIMKNGRDTLGALFGHEV